MRKLIEVSIPLDAINREAAREKSIRHGHPSTLHLWWARRPLAACRAVLFSQLVDDPSAHPEEFPTEEAQAVERARLHRLIEELVKWENSNNAEVLDAAKAEIRKSCGDDIPPILDPFAGGGSIPLEAQRLGLEAHASDLNPVAVLICKALIEIPPRWAGRPPIHPDSDRLPTQAWTGAQGLAEDVRWYGKWLRDEAEKRIGHLYPKAALPDGSEAPVIAWIWARTVQCPNPACGATMPLVSSFWLGRKKGKERWLQPIVEGKSVRFEIGCGREGPPDSPKVGRGAKFRCLVCGEVAPETHIKSEGMAGCIGTQLLAVVAAGHRQRIYLPPADADYLAADVKRPDDVPESDLPNDPRAIWCRLYGLLTHADLFTSRQLVALTTLSDLVAEAHSRVVRDGARARLDDGNVGAYADDVATYLGLAVSRLSDYSSTLTTWASNPQMEILRNTFARQALPMTWDFAEGNVFGPSSGSMEILLRAVTEALERLPAIGIGESVQADAATHDLGLHQVLVTDPPYYDNIGYSDLADFFYVWLRRTLRTYHPDLFKTVLTPKTAELIANPYRHGGSRERARKAFRKGFIEAFTNAQKSHDSSYPLSLFYAFKQAEGEDEGDMSTGWEMMLEGLLGAGLKVTATWPIRTEKPGRSIGIGTNALASSIVLTCRPRHASAGVTDRRGFVAALKAELPNELGILTQANIAPVDLAQAAIGPGMAVFSRYAKVVEASGNPMRVRTALGLINQVLAEVLDEQEGAFDPETRWAIKWFEQHGVSDGSSGVADQLCRTYGTALNALQEAGLVRAHRAKTRLLGRDELPEGWDPATDAHVPIWEATQHMVKRLLDEGEEAAADLLRRLGGLGESVQLLAYRLHAISDRCGWTTEAIAYNALGASWTEIQRRAQQQPGLEQRALLS